MERINGGGAVIAVKGVSVFFGAKRALRDVDFCLPQGQIVGLFGENGAGKTTLMKCILAFLRYTGEIPLDGAPVSTKNISRISFATSEHSFFPNLSAESHKEFYQMHFPGFKTKRFEGLMGFFQLPAGKSLRRFSQGQKNQFEVILSLSQGADYILMDEPFAGSDVFIREDFYKVLLGILEPTKFSFSQKQNLGEREYGFAGVCLDTTFGDVPEFLGVSDGGAADKTDSVRDIASRTVPGQERTENVCVKDHHEFYPIRVEFGRPHRFSVNEDTVRLFAEYFKIPVYPEDKWAITIAKD